MKEFEEATFNKETVASDTKKETEQDRGKSQSLATIYKLCESNTVG